MIVDIIALVLLILGAVVEFWIYDKAMWWHSGPKADRRNWTPLARRGGATPLAAPMADRARVRHATPKPA